MNQSQLPLVSVVIPHRGPDAPLKLCIEALRQQTYPPSQIEILIVINEFMRRKPFFALESNEKILWQPDYYSYAARNKGIEASKGSIIALTDSDAIPDSCWIAHGAGALEEGSDMVAGRIELTYSRYPLTPPACYEKLFAFDQEKNVRFGRAATANLLVKRSTFETNGLFDQFSESGEDFSWTQRATQRGTRLIFDGDVSVSHPARENFFDLLIKARRVSGGYTAGRHPFERLASATSQYVSVYLVPPSLTKRSASSGRELLLGYGTSLLIQVVKLFFFLQGEIHRAGRSIPQTFVK